MDRLEHVNKQVESLTNIVRTIVVTINLILDTLNILLKNSPKTEENKEMQTQIDIMKDVLVSFLREPSHSGKLFAFKKSMYSSRSNSKSCKKVRNSVRKSRRKSRRKNPVRSGKRGRKVRKSR